MSGARSVAAAASFRFVALAYQPCWARDALFAAQLPSQVSSQKWSSVFPFILRLHNRDAGLRQALEIFGAGRWQRCGQAKSITDLAEQEGVTDALCLPAPTANLSCAVHQRNGWSYSRDNAGGGPQFEGRPCHRNPITSLIQDWIGGAPLSAPLGLFHRLIGTVTSRHRPTIKPSSTAGSIEAGRHGEHRDLVVTRRRITREQLWDHDQLRTIRRAAHREVGGPG
jgi:hypothetical protein